VVWVSDQHILKHQFWFSLQVGNWRAAGWGEPGSTCENLAAAMAEAAEAAEKEAEAAATVRLQLG
jgi:hypothetical protein